MNRWDEEESELVNGECRATIIPPPHATTQHPADTETRCQFTSTSNAIRSNGREEHFHGDFGQNHLNCVGFKSKICFFNFFLKNHLLTCRLLKIIASITRCRGRDQTSRIISQSRNRKRNEVSFVRFTNGLLDMT